MVSSNIFRSGRITEDAADEPLLPFLRSSSSNGFRAGNGKMTFIGAFNLSVEVQGAP